MSEKEMRLLGLGLSAGFWLGFIVAWVLKP
jgi:hypothetical protein